MKQVIYLATEEDAEDLDLTFAALHALGVEARRIHPEQLSVELRPGQAAALYCRGEPVSADLVVGWVFEEELAPGMALLQTLASNGVKVLNPGETLFGGQNKLLMSALLLAHGVPHLPIHLVGTMRDLERLTPSLVFPVVIKSPYVVCGGLTRRTAGGASVLRADTLPALRTLAELHFSFRQPLYLQQMLDKPGRIIDANVIDYTTCTATHKYAAAGEWRTNLARGARRFEDCEISAPIREVAESAARALGARIAGINIAECGTGLVVIEGNTCPTFAQYLDLYGKRIYDAVARMIHKEMS